MEWEWDGTYSEARFGAFASRRGTWMMEQAGIGPGRAVRLRLNLKRGEDPPPAPARFHDPIPIPRGACLLGLHACTTYQRGRRAGETTNKRTRCTRCLQAAAGSGAV